MSESQHEDVQALIAERARFAQWLEQLASQTTAPPHVVDRVRADYQQRLDGVVARLAGRLAELEAQHREAESRLALAAAREQEVRDARAEAELRHAVGEFTATEWAERVAASDEALGEARRASAEAREQRDRLAAVLAEARRPARRTTPIDLVPEVPAAPPAPAPARPAAPRHNAAPPPRELSLHEDDPPLPMLDLEPQELAPPPAPPGPAAPADAARSKAPDFAGLEGFDDLAFLRTIAGRPSEPAQVPPPVRPSRQVSAVDGLAAEPDEAAPPRTTQPVSRQDLAYEPPPPAPPPATPAGAAPPAASAPAAPAAPAPAPEPRPPEPPTPRISHEYMAIDRRPPRDVSAMFTDTSDIVIPDPAGRGAQRGSVAEPSKTLKCAECGAMNYPTEWYCERCGGELAAM